MGIAVFTLSHFNSHMELFHWQKMQKVLKSAEGHAVPAKSERPSPSFYTLAEFSVGISKALLYAIFKGLQIWWIIIISLPPKKAIIKSKLAETEQCQNKVILQAAIILPLGCEMYCTQMHWNILLARLNIEDLRKAKCIDNKCLKGRFLLWCFKCSVFQRVSSFSLNKPPKCFLHNFAFSPRNKSSSWNPKQQWQLFCMLRRHYLKSDISYPCRLRNRSFLSLQRADLQLPNCSEQLLLSNPVRTWCIKVEIINFWHEKLSWVLYIYLFLWSQSLSLIELGT